ncbi:50S ribosomal protein L18 [Candidatus Uhrbacteria bacterium]|nr:50S ribosomal protein L18 [Candidatus Uhrbacteria bacterium]
MKEALQNTQVKRLRRARRIRARIHGTAQCPRLSVHLSNRQMFAQCIDDAAKVTLCAVSDTILDGKVQHLKVDRAFEFGKRFAQLAKDKGIIKVIFDRGARAYHGRVKAFAEGAREAGLKF